MGTLAVGYAHLSDPRSRDAWRVDAFETALLWVYFLVVPPILAVGLYFSLWHLIRHIARVVALDETGRAALADGQIGAVPAGFVREAVPNTAGAVCLLAALFMVQPATDPDGLHALYLVVLAILTLPHTLVVTWLDDVQDLWTPDETV